MSPSDGFSHIVVGAGAAGCALAARLSEDAGTNVLLIEAGGAGRYDPLLQVPMMTALLLRGSRHTWQYLTGAEQGLDGRQVELPRGRVLGGSTAINGMVYVRGLAQDYDGWAQAGMPDWSWDKVRPYFLRSEHFAGPGDPTHHARSGPLTVSRRARPVSKLVNAFVDAGIAAGHPECPDFNVPEPEGFGFYHFTIRNGRRESAATAFLRDARARKNLTIVTGAEVSRIVFQGDRASAVEVMRAGSKELFHTDGEIILSGGAVGSPAILMRSGIGPAGDLSALDIPVLADIADVGGNLHDHVLIRVCHEAPEAATLHGLTRIDRAGVAFLRAWLTGTGPMTVFPLEAGAYLRGPESDIPNIQSHFLPALSSATVRFNPFAKPVNATPGFMANASVMRPASRGRLRLTGADAGAPLDIRVNYLSDPRDVAQLVDAVELLRDVFAQAPFDPYRGAEISPGPEITTRTDLEAWVRQTASTVHHLCGTCRMGADPGSVVDPELRVRGVRGLRVADASVFPSIPSTNTAAPTIMVAEKAAELVLNAG
ncbi:MAG: GMC family oxidoreductase N-terminal domain-containing protein [Paracoccaceae bacterium]